MTRQKALGSPFGAVTVTEEPAYTRIDADEDLGGDWGLGWWHARAAGDEAVFCRSFWRAELGRSTKGSVARTEVDSFVAHWGFGTDLDQEDSRLSPAHRARVVAYTAGFNAGRRSSSEVPWTTADCHLLVRTLGFLEWWETRGPLVEFLLDALRTGLSWDLLSELFPDLGTEPDRSRWKDLEFPHPFSAEARVLVNRMRRFRGGPGWVVPGTKSATGRPLVASGWTTDVSDPGMPFLPVRIERPGSSVRGLSRPGHPGFLCGHTRRLTWSAWPVVDDGIDLRILEREDSRQLTGVWAGLGQTGGLSSLLTIEDSPSAAESRDLTLHLGSAALDWVAADVRGGTEAWSTGPRWLRPDLRDAWLPTPWGSEVPVGSRRQPGDQRTLPGKWTPDQLKEALVRRTPRQLDELMAPLRFLLPDTEAGLELRRWAGSPAEGAQSRNWERLTAAVWTEFWDGRPGAGAPGSPAAYGLLPAFVRLLQAPHSAWWPSQDKNRRLADAVRAAFSGAPVEGPSTLGSLAARALWTEAHTGRKRIYAATAFALGSPGEQGWETFVTDDETEAPRFSRW